MEQPIYQYTHEGVSYAMTAGEIHRKFVSHKSSQWVKLGLIAGAKDILGLVNFAEERQKKARVNSWRGSQNTPLRVGFRQTFDVRNNRLSPRP